ncbi:uncharacterized protein [Nicotiana tomentosiformis]|uniref:uncharacterized protein n=1 Tax=Nicotiana tomentosiformis TaxID=4098 RepID=UPI00388CA079
MVLDLPEEYSHDLSSSFSYSNLDHVDFIFGDLQEYAWIDLVNECRNKLRIILQEQSAAQNEVKKERKEWVFQKSLKDFGLMSSIKNPDERNRKMHSELGVEFTSSQKRKKSRGVFFTSYFLFVYHGDMPQFKVWGGDVNIGHIIETTNEKENDNVKRKNKVEVVTTKNKFDALEVEEIDQPTLRIIDGKGVNNSKAQQKKQQGVESKKVQENEQSKRVEDSTSNPKNNGISIGESVKELEKARNSSIKPTENQVHVDNKSLKKGEEARHAKREAMLEVANKEREEANKGKSSNPNPYGILSSGKNRVQDLDDASSPNLNDAGIEENIRKESTIE